MKNLSTKTVGIILTLIGFSVIAFADVGLKVGGRSYDAFEVAFFVNIATTLFMLPIIFYYGGIKKALKTKSLKMHALRSYIMLASFLAIIHAFDALPIPTVYVIVFTMPFILNVLSIFLLKEHISPHRWVAIIIGISGVLIALRPDKIEFEWAILIACITPLFGATANIIVKFIDKSDHWLSYTLYIMIFQTPVLAAMILFRGGTLIPDFTDMTMITWLFASGGAFAIGLSLLPQALHRIDASVLGSLVYIVFPWGVFYGFFIFGDLPDRWTLLGAMIIIASGLFLIYRERVEDSKLLKTDIKTDK